MKKGEKILWIILGSIMVFFFVLIFLSSKVQSSVKIDRDFESEVSQTEKNIIELGTVTYTNANLLPVRVPLKTLVACKFLEDTESAEAYFVRYRGRSLYISDEPFSYHFEGFIDMKSRQEQTLILTIEKEPKEKFIEGDIYIFELNDKYKPRYHYNFEELEYICDNKKAERPLHKITFTNEV